MTEFISCRLCLSYSTTDFCNLFDEKQQQNEMQQKILKYLYIEIKEDDPFTKNVCLKCVERLEDFHVYSTEIASNQEILQYAAPQSIVIASYNLKTDNIIVRLQTTDQQHQQIQLQPSTSLQIKNFLPPPMNQSPIINLTMPIMLEEDGTNDITVCEIDENEEVQATIMESTEQEVHEIPETVVIKTEEGVEITCAPKTRKKRKSKKSTRNRKIEEKTATDESSVIEDDSDSDGSVDFDKDDETVDDAEDLLELFGEDEKFSGFPRVMIKDAKLIVRGQRLLDLMSRFYRLECDICQENNGAKSSLAYTRLSSLCLHYNEMHSMKGYVVCCGAKLIKPRAMAMHMSRHLQPQAFRCPICKKMMTCPKILQYHIQNHLPEEQRPLACPQCPRKFSYGSALVSHAISHQPEHERAVHICDECGKSFSSSGRLSTHMNISHINHGNDYICHICAKQFSCRSNLTYHLTTHQPKIHQVQCEQCGKWLKNKLCLRKHMVQHSTLRYACDICDYSALNRQCLCNHMKVQHSDIKPFSCEFCGKTFKLRNTLLNHMVQHTGIKKFSCEFCNKTFASSGNYYSHRKRMHPQELAAVNEKKEQAERLLRAAVIESRLKAENV